MKYLTSKATLENGQISIDLKNPIVELYCHAYISADRWYDRTVKLEENFKLELTKFKLINNYSLNLFHQFGLYN
jgi:hypothetical protein